MGITAPRIRSLLIFLVLLVPSAQFAWRNRQMPQFASLHDDGLFFISAKSLASTHTYRLPDLVENPAQTKYPPLYPLYLSIAWSLNPRFPDNLVLATGLSWAVLAGFLGLAWKLYRQQGFSDPRVWVLAALLGANPYIVLFGCTLFSEIFFTCWLLATFLALSRGGVRMAVLAGVFAGLAYLSRTAGIVLLVSVPAWMVWKGEKRRAAAFAAAMLPAVLGWMLWARLHATHSTDQTLMYYTDYIGYQFLNVRMDNLVVVLWKNLDQVLLGMGSLVVPKVIDLLPLKILAQVIALAMISGIVRLVRRGILVDYALFGLGSVGLLLIWHFPATERFVLPLFPLLLAGLVTEIEHIGQMLKTAFRHPDTGQRVVGMGFAAAVVLTFVAAFVLQLFVTFVFLHESAGQSEAKLRDQRAAYHWIDENLPPSAAILSYDDPLLYLYTSRRGNVIPLLPRWWYSGDHNAVIGAYRDIAAYCRNRGLEYVYFTSEDLARDTGDEDRRAVQQIMRENTELSPVFEAGIGTIYKIGH